MAVFAFFLFFIHWHSFYSTLFDMYLLWRYITENMVFSLILSSIYWSENFTKFILAGFEWNYYVQCSMFQLSVERWALRDSIPWQNNKFHLKTKTKNKRLTENCLSTSCVCMNGQNRRRNEKFLIFLNFFHSVIDDKMGYD